VARLTEPQSSRNDGVRESLETCRAETVFDERRRAILDVLGVSPEEPTIVGSQVPASNGSDGDAAQGAHDSRQGVAGIFNRLIDLPDAIVMEIITIVMGETLASGSAAVAAAGAHIGIDMADWWEADAVFFELVRDRHVLSRIAAEVAGKTVANANAGEKAKVLKRIVADHLAGANGRAKVEGWVPRWMAFPASAYTTRGGVGTVAAQAKAEAARSVEPQTDSEDEPFEQAA